MVIPTTYMALHDPDVYENPDYFDPERYYSGDAEVKGAKNYLVFGTGPHYCLGQVYAQLNLALFVGKAACQLKWTHHPTPRSEEIKVFATIFPMVRDPPPTLLRRVYLRSTELACRMTALSPLRNESGERNQTLTPSNSTMLTSRR